MHFLKFLRIIVHPHTTEAWWWHSQWQLLQCFLSLQTLQSLFYFINALTRVGEMHPCLTLIVLLKCSFLPLHLIWIAWYVVLLRNIHCSFAWYLISLLQTWYACLSFVLNEFLIPGIVCHIVCLDEPGIVKWLSNSSLFS